MTIESFDREHDETRPNKIRCDKIRFDETRSDEAQQSNLVGRGSLTREST